MNGEKFAVGYTNELIQEDGGPNLTKHEAVILKVYNVGRVLWGMH